MRVLIRPGLHLWIVLFSLLSINILKAQIRLLTSHELQKARVYTSLEEALGAPEKVYRLDLSHQNLTDISQEIATLKDLQELNISGNHFQEIPEAIFRLPRLQILYANHNQLYRISESIVFLQNLEELYLVGNPILEVSYQIQNLPRLHKLELSQNLTFELYQSNDNFQNLTLLSVVNSSILKISETNNLPSKARRVQTASEIERKYATSPLKNEELKNTQPKNNTHHLESTISGLKKDNDHLEQKLNSLTKDLDQSQSLHQKLKQEKDSVLHAKKAVLEEKQKLEAQIQAKKLTSRLLIWGSVLLICTLIAIFGVYIYRIRHDYSSLKAKLGEQEEEIEDNEDIIRQQAHIISEQNQILKSLKDENKAQDFSF